MTKKAGTEKVTKWDIQSHLTTEKARRAFLKAALADHGDDPAYIAACLGEVARARGMDKVAQATGFSRQGLYKSLNASSNPSFALVMKVAHEFGMELRMSTHASYPA